MDLHGSRKANGRRTSGRAIMAIPHISSYVSNDYFVQHKTIIFVLPDKPSRSLLNAKQLV
jgi:hypothetical protein